MTTKPLLNVEDLRVAYRDTEVLHGVSLQVHPGESVAIVGESGSGKSTLAQSVIRLLPHSGAITSGSIEFEGTDLVGLSRRQMRKRRGRRIGLIPQDPMLSLNPVLTVGRQVAEALEIHAMTQSRGETRERTYKLLTSAGLSNPQRIAGQYPGELSGGMRQRVLIAIAIACRPALVIADEPTSALDVTVQRQILDHIDELREVTGAALLMITHDLGVAADRSNRIVVMNAGEVVETGDTGVVLKTPEHDYTKRLLAASPGMASSTLLPQAQTGPSEELTKRQPMLVVTDLRKSFPTRDRDGSTRDATVVDDVSFEISAGQTMALVGGSGSGKSTTARIVMQLETADHGEIILNGNRMGGLDQRQIRPLRKDFQMVYQDPFGSLNPRMSIGSIVAEPMRLHSTVPRGQRSAKVEKLLESVALPAHFASRRPAQLSGGQRQRVAIARALAVDPKLIVCDEPVSALDVSVQDQILKLLVRLQEELGITYLFISHDLAVVRKIAHHVAVLQEGRIVERGPTEAVFNNPSHKYTRQLLEAIPGHQLAGDTPALTTTN